MGRTAFKTTEEIAKKFIQNGWDKNTSFEELTLEEAKKKGHLFAVNGICNGRKFFRMNVSGNIFDDTGNVVLYNVGVNTDR